MPILPNDAHFTQLLDGGATTKSRWIDPRLIATWRVGKLAGVAYDHTEMVVPHHGTIYVVGHIDDIGNQIPNSVKFTELLQNGATSEPRYFHSDFIVTWRDGEIPGGFPQDHTEITVAHYATLFVLGQIDAITQQILNAKA